MKRFFQFERRITPVHVLFALGIAAVTLSVILAVHAYSSVRRGFIEVQRQEEEGRQETLKNRSLGFQIIESEKQQARDLSQIRQTVENLQDVCQ